MPLVAIQKPRLFVGWAPVCTFLSATTMNLNTANGVSLGIPAKDRVIIVGASARSGQITKVTINGIALLPYAAAGAAGQGSFTSIWSGLVPDDPLGTIWTPEGSLGTNPILNIYRATGLSRIAPRDAQSSATAADVARAVDLNTEVGGFIIACAVNNVGAANSVTWTGDETPTEDSDSALGSGRQSGMSRLTTIADAANTITATFAVISTTQISLSAASFR